MRGNCILVYQYLLVAKLSVLGGESYLEIIHQEASSPRDNQLFTLRCIGQVEKTCTGLSVMLSMKRVCSQNRAFLSLEIYSEFKH